MASRVSRPHRHSVRLREEAQVRGDREGPALGWQAGRDGLCWTLAPAVGSGVAGRKSGARRPGSQPPAPACSMEWRAASLGHSCPPRREGTSVPGRPPPSPWLPGLACGPALTWGTLVPWALWPPRPLRGPARAAHLPPRPPLPTLCSEMGALGGGASEWPLRGLCWELRGTGCLAFSLSGTGLDPKGLRSDAGFVRVPAACPQSLPHDRDE